MALFHVKISSWKRNKWLKSVYKQGNWDRQTFVVICDIGFGIPNKFPLERNKIGWNWSKKKEIGLRWFRETLEQTTMSDLKSPSNF